MNKWRCFSIVLVAAAIGLVTQSGCPGPSKRPPDSQDPSDSAAQPRTAEDRARGTAAADQQRVATADPADVAAARELLDDMEGAASYELLPGDLMTKVEIRDGSNLTAEAIELLGKLTDLETLRIMNFRGLNDAMVQQLAGLNQLTALALTNSAITDASIELIVQSFPGLTELDLSYNTVVTNSALKTICELDQLERLTLIQNNFNDTATGNLAKLEKLRVLDLRGCLASDLTMEVLGPMPNLAVLKHRSGSVSDFGIEFLAQSPTLREYDIDVEGPNTSLRSLLMQDFAITDEAGEYLAMMPNLAELEIFRCQGFGSAGLLALKGMPLTRLKLRDLPAIRDDALEVFQELPTLRRLELHEINSVTDDGLQNLGELAQLEVLDIWSIPKMTDATVDVIATLPNLKQLSIRATAVTDAAVAKILAMPKLTILTFQENAAVTDQARQELAAKEWAKLEL